MVNVNIASHVSVMFQHYIHNLEPISYNNDNDAATISIRNSEYPYICKSLDSNSFLQNQGKFPMRTLTDGHVFLHDLLWTNISGITKWISKEQKKDPVRLARCKRIRSDLIFHWSTYQSSPSIFKTLQAHETKIYWVKLRIPWN